MLNLAKVICLLLVAEATSAFDLSPLSSTQQSLEREIYSSSKKILGAYENAKMNIDKVMSQIKLSIPHQPSCWNNEGSQNYPQIGQKHRSEDDCISVECSKLFNKLVEANKEKMIECSQVYVKSVQFQHDRVKETALEILLKLVIDETYLSKSCVLSHSDNYVGRVRASWCVKMVERELPDIAKAAESEFSAIVRDVQKTRDLWSSDAIYCAAAGVGPTVVIELHNACKASKPFEDN